jgi:hypothetical protein
MLIPGMRGSAQRRIGRLLPTACAGQQSTQNTPPLYLWTGRRRSQLGQCDLAGTITQPAGQFSAAARFLFGSNGLRMIKSGLATLVKSSGELFRHNVACR